MERSAWTDERLDDFAATVTGELRLLRTEVRDEFRAVRGEIGELRADLSAWHGQIARIGWARVVALVGAIAAIVVAIV